MAIFSSEKCSCIISYILIFSSSPFFIFSVTIILLLYFFLLIPNFVSFNFILSIFLLEVTLEETSSNSYSSIKYLLFYISRISFTIACLPCYCLITFLVCLFMFYGSNISLKIFIIVSLKFSELSALLL